MIDEINYPIKFVPILKEKVWGGNKLVSELNKKSTKQNVGESWELSGVEGDISIVANGFLVGKSISKIIEKYKAKFLGLDNYKRFGVQFPLLFKFIDAKDDLSIQLHPNDEIAKKKHDSFGKTEMWYIIDSEENKSKIYNGFSKKINKETYLDSVNNGELLSLVNVDSVKKGDIFFIEAGKIHAIGKGVLLAEIQQTSDVTYRIYDWDRFNENGEYRMLHSELALEALDFSSVGSCKLNCNTEKHINSLVDCEYFVTNKLNLTNQFERDISQIDSFIVYMCVEGVGSVAVNGMKEDIRKGETIIVPAVTDIIKFCSIDKGSLTLLEVFI